MPSLASFQLTPPQDAREFEQLMRDYCNCIYPGMACLFARPGQKQYGVDVVSTGSNGVVAIQCKNYQDMSVSISMIDQWIQGAEEFKPEISHFIIAIGAKTDGEIQKYVLEKNQYRQSHNLFSVEVVYWEEISAFLKSDARILQRYYPFINTIIGMTYDFLPFMILPLYTTLSKLDKSVIEAASDLGADNFQTFIKVILPLSVPGIVSGVSMVFLPAMTNYVVLDMLYNSTYIMGSLIGSYFSAYDWHNGSMIALILLVIICIVTLVSGDKESENAGRGGLV